MSGRAVLAAAVLLLAAAAAVAPAAEQRPDPLAKFQWNLAAIQAPAAWPTTRGAGVTVAVLDTGVAYENRGRYRRAPELAAARIAPGRDFVDGDRHPNDVPPASGRRSHGTQMATLIAATAGNGIGGAGVAPEVTIMPVRVLKPDLAGTSRAIAAGLRFAADHGADVANLSISGPRPTRRLRAAINYARRKGVTIVAAAGNEGRDAVSWPAAFPGVIAVGAVDRRRVRAPYSNFGRMLDLVAPGGAGARFDTGYGPSDGVQSQTVKEDPATFCFCFTASTSAAAAQVSGVAALVIASGRARSPAAVRAALIASARDLGRRGPDPEYGAGLVQARGAVGAETTPSPSRPARRAPRPDTASGSGRLVPALIGAALAGLAIGAVLLWRRRRPTGGG